MKINVQRIRRARQVYYDRQMDLLWWRKLTRIVWGGMSLPTGIDVSAFPPEWVQSALWCRMPDELRRPLLEPSTVNPAATGGNQ